MRKVSNRVLIRDFLVFQLKLLLDGLTGFIVSQLAIGAVVLDLLFGGAHKGRLFYRVLGAAERIDLWLNLYGASTRASESGDGLFGSLLSCGRNRPSKSIMTGTKKKLGSLGDSESLSTRGRE